MEYNLPVHNEPLYRFWEGIVAPAKNQPAPGRMDWNQQVYHLSLHGRGMEEALHYLYASRPTFAAFMDWLQVTKPAVPDESHTSEQFLSAKDMDFWHDNGYIVIRNAIPAGQCAAAREAIWAYLGANPNDAATWYEPHNGKKGMMLAFFQHPALIANRQSAIIRQCYRQLYGNSDIYLLVDKVSYNPPETDSYSFTGSPLHWDVSLQPPIPFELQGLLYLTDVSAADGAFHCVPGFHKKIDEWINGLPKDTDPREAALSQLEPVAIPGAAGDLVIWHPALPHCATANKGTVPRMVQYIAYKPIKASENSVWK